MLKASNSGASGLSVSSLYTSARLGLVALLTLVALPIMAQRVPIIPVDEDGDPPHPGLPPMLESVAPAEGADHVALDSNISATFDRPIMSGGARVFIAHGGMSGQLNAAYSGAGGFTGTGSNTITLNPNHDFFPGEMIETTLTTGVRATTGGYLAHPHVWRFTASSRSGPGTFRHAQAIAGGFGTHCVKLADFNGDGNLDILAVSSLGTHRLMIGNGRGEYHYHCSLSCVGQAQGAVVADFNGDGTMDVAFVTQGQCEIRFNAGGANFSQPVAFGGTQMSWYRFGQLSDVGIGIAAGDTDGDGDQDIVLARSGACNQVWLNQYDRFVLGCEMGNSSDPSMGVELCDADADGDLDLVEINTSAPCCLYRNNGSGGYVWAGSHTAIVTSGSIGASAVGDFDGDGDSDVVAAKTWKYGLSSLYAYDNDGMGNFHERPLSINVQGTVRALLLADVDGDGDLDVAVGCASPGPTPEEIDAEEREPLGGLELPEPPELSDMNYLHFNDGSGSCPTCVQLGVSELATRSLCAGDLDGDGDLDIVESASLAQPQMLLNHETADPGVSLFDVRESSAVNADNLHVISATPTFAWKYAQDLWSGEVMAAYNGFEMLVDNESSFTAPFMWQSGLQGQFTETVDGESGVSTVVYGVGGPPETPLAQGGLYYARIRTYRFGSVTPGPWYELTFRRNTPPTIPTVVSPIGSTGDATPAFVWRRQYDAEGDSQHFTLNVNGTLFDSKEHEGTWEISTDSGASWQALPRDGAPAGDNVPANDDDLLVRCTPSGVVSSGTWSVRATDGYATTGFTTAQGFSIAAAVTLRGKLYNASGNPTSGNLVVYTSATPGGATTSADGSGAWSLNVAGGSLVTGSPILVAISGGTGATLIEYNSQDADNGGSAAVDQVIDVRASILNIEQRLASPISAAAFDDYDGQASVPFTVTGTSITFNTVSAVNLTGAMDAGGFTSMSLPSIGLNPLAGSSFTSLTGTAISCNTINPMMGARVQLRGGSLSLAATSFVMGEMKLEGCSLALANNVDLQILGNGLVIGRNANVTGSGSSRIHASAGGVDWTDSTFTGTRLYVDFSGVLKAFDRNTFSGTVSTERIFWSSSVSHSTSSMTGIVFSGSATSNVKATASGVRRLNMVGSTGSQAGETFDDDLLNIVDWIVPVPSGVQAQAGVDPATGIRRVRISWNSAGTLPASYSYEVFRRVGTEFPGILVGSTTSTSLVNTSSGASAPLLNTTYTYAVRMVTGTTQGDFSEASLPVTPRAVVFDNLDSNGRNVIPSSVNAPSSGNISVPMTLVGGNTHFDTVNPPLTNLSTVTVTGLSVPTASRIVLSPNIIICDVTVLDTSSGAKNVQVSTASVLGAYTESVTATNGFTVNASVTLPTIAFNAATPAEGSSTTSNFTLSIDYGGSAQRSTLEVMASRNTTIANAFVNFASSFSAGNPAVLNVSGQFSNGEYTIYTRIADGAGSNAQRTNWIARRIIVNGASPLVASTTSRPVMGRTNQTVVLTSNAAFSGVSDVTFTNPGITRTGSITVNSSSQITIQVNVSASAALGFDAFTVVQSGTDPVGQITVAYPTDLYPDITNNEEPVHNAATGGVSVLLTNGAFFHGKTDLAQRGRMMGISWSRFYRSDVASTGAGYNGPLGEGWHGYYYQRMRYTDNTGTGAGNSAGDTVEWFTPGGRKETFSWSAGTRYNPPAGIYAVIDRNNTTGEVTLTDRHGHKCIFRGLDGKLVRCEDRNGNALTCDYNGLGQLIGINDDRRTALGLSTASYTISYNAQGRVSTVTDNVWTGGSAPDFFASGPRSISYGYDANGHLTSQQAPQTTRYNGASRITFEYQYDSSHRLTHCINPREGALASNTPWLINTYTNGNVTQQRYGEDADTLENQEKPEQLIFLNYNTTVAAASLVKIVDRRGLRTDYALATSTSGSNLAGAAQSITRYTAFWNATATTQDMAKLRATDEDSYTTSFTYFTSNFEVKTVTYPQAYSENSNNKSVEYEYNNNLSTPVQALGNVTKVTRTPDARGFPAGQNTLVTSYTYEPFFQFVDIVTNPRGFATNHDYDARGNLITVTSPTLTVPTTSGGTTSAPAIKTRTTYNEFGQPVSSIDGEGNVTLYEYFTSGSQVGFLQFSTAGYGDLNLKSEFQYDRVGNLTASWPPRAFETGTRNDNFMTSQVVNELNQSWHSTGRVIGGTAREEVYRYFDANFNLSDTIREYIAVSGITIPPGVGADVTVTYMEPNKPSAAAIAAGPAAFAGGSFKSVVAMNPTWVQSTTTYPGVLNYPKTRTVESVANGASIDTLTSTTVYDANYNVIESHSPLGLRSKTSFDERDMVYRSIPGADSDVEATYQTDYDLNGNVAKSIDANFNVTTYFYDGYDRTTHVMDPQGHYSLSSYDENSNVTQSQSFEDPDSVAGSSPDPSATELSSSESTFDEIDRGYKSERVAKDHTGANIGDGLATNLTLFDSNSRTVWNRDDNSVFHYSFYDSANRLVRSRDNLGNEMQYELDANSNGLKTIIREVNGLTGDIEIAHAAADFDTLDRRIHYRDTRHVGTGANQLNTQTAVAYDGWNRSTTSVDAAGVRQDFAYDLLSRSTISTRYTAGHPGTNATNIVTTTLYDEDSRVIGREIGRGDGSFQTTDYEYDERGRMIAQRRPDNSEWLFHYDRNSNPLGWTDPLGTRVTDTFDSRNLIKHRHVVRGAQTSGTVHTSILGTTDESYAFDGLGRLASAANYGNLDGSATAHLMTSTRFAYNTLSLPEVKEQTIANFAGDIVGTYTSSAEYDATGFTTATVNAFGRRLEHQRDGLNRLAGTWDATANSQLVNYMYSGPSRLIRRSYGNGTVTKYDYESSGCGCGGFTNYITRVAHVAEGQGPAGSDDVLFAVSRRYDKVGNVTVERREDAAEQGKVFRYDDTYRLTSAYVGTVVTVAQLDTFDENLSGVGQVPTVFGLKRSYNLDVRGNRTGTNGVRESSDMGNPGATVKDSSYTPDSNTNEYDVANGMNYVFDNIEQTIFDPSTGLYQWYDYKGNLVAVDDDAPASPPTSPLRCMVHDVWNLKVCMTYKHDSGSIAVPDLTEVTPHDMGAGSCGCEAGENTASGTLFVSAAGEVGQTVLGTEQYVVGKGATPGGGGGTSPTVAVGEPSGTDQGGTVIAYYVKVGAGNPEICYRHEDQLGSQIGVTDGSGRMKQKALNDSFGGAPMVEDVMIRFTRPQMILAEYRPETVLELAFALGSFSQNEFNGCEIVARSASGTALTRQVIHATLANSGWQSRICILDPNNLFIDDFLNCASIEVLRFVDTRKTSAPTTASSGGDWTSLPSYNAGMNETTFTMTGAEFAQWQVGSMLIPNAGKPASFEITKVAVDGNSVTIKGNATTLSVVIGTRFRIASPPGVDVINNGGLEVYWMMKATRYLFAGYRYEFPVAGQDLGGAGVQGRQPGSMTGSSNQSGTYYCWNRIYDPSIGRWTTPDPAQSPVWNLYDYCGNAPVQWTDQRGLEEKKELTDEEKEAEAWKVHSEYVQAYLNFWMTHMGMTDANKNPLSDKCKKNLLCIIRLVSWVESMHGTGAGNEPAKDPMQSGNPQDAWWRSLTGGTPDDPKTEDEDESKSKGCRFIGGKDKPNYWASEIANDAEFKKAAKAAGIPEEAYDIYGHLKDKTKGHSDDKFNAKMSYFWGILYLLHQFRTEDRFYRCGCDDFDAMVKKASGYNGGGDEKYGEKLKKARELIKCDK